MESCGLDEIIASKFRISDFGIASFTFKEDTGNTPSSDSLYSLPKLWSLLCLNSELSFQGIIENENMSFQLPSFGTLTNHLRAIRINVRSPFVSKKLHLTRTVEPGRISDGTVMSSVGFLLSWTKDLLPSTSASNSIWPNGIIFHQPQFSWNKVGFPETSATFWGPKTHVRSVQFPVNPPRPAWNMVPRRKWQSHQRCSPMGHSGVMIRQLYNRFTLGDGQSEKNSL